MVARGGLKVEHYRCVEATMVSDSSEEDAAGGGAKMEVLVLHRECGELHYVLWHGSNDVECNGNRNMVKMEARVSHLGYGKEMMRWKIVVGQFG